MMPVSFGLLFAAASLEDRLPIVGFSAAFVRVGALAGISPDYRETGRKAALRRMRGDYRGADDSPSKVRVAVSQRVARLLGIFAVEVFR